MKNSPPQDGTKLQYVLRRRIYNENEIKPFY
jgi:hypothetical protein